MPENKPFNPIEISNIALSLALEVLEQPVHSLALLGKPIGAGVYLLYYCGDHPAYRAMSARNTKEAPKTPIYIGKADRKGKRKGFTFEPGFGLEIRKRLQDHVKSIGTVGLSSGEFSYRYLSIEDAFIGLAESVLVSIFDPLWNRILDGFGNNPTGGPRSNQAISKWDQFHPGRRRGAGEGRLSLVELDLLVSNHFAPSDEVLEERLVLIRKRIEKYGLA